MVEKMRACLWQADIKESFMLIIPHFSLHIYYFQRIYEDIKEVNEKLLSDERRKFLEHFPENRRSGVANKFLDVIRKGVKDPEVILAEVYEKVNQLGRGKDIAEVIYEYMSEARDYINYLFTWENLTWEEKKKIKSQRGETYRQEYMSRQQPTEAQLQYIKALRYKGNPPENKAEASEIINNIKERKY